MMSRKLLSMILVLALAFSLSAIGLSALADEPAKEPLEEETAPPAEEGETEEPAAPLFSDVPEDAAYAEAVAWAVESSIVTGYDDGTFKPGNTVTRGQAAVFLHRLAGEPEVTGDGSAFSDVEAGAYYENAVAWASVTGIITGYPNGTFKPAAPVSRQDLAVLILRYATEYVQTNFVVTLQYTIFTDEDQIADYAKNAVQMLYKLGVLTGIENETTLIINPTDGATRAQTVAALYSFAEVLENAATAEEVPAADGEATPPSADDAAAPVG
ncbi:MAG: S-layer homology domain-containing protein [Oscillospiraceae bacterium]|jgi:hypothetical protein|nr:S-layer homology domain-containing protein [Oscillospiraceae bacterium]